MLLRVLGVLLFVGLLAVSRPSSAGASDPDTYVVQRGDTIYQIARRLDVSPSALIQLNQLADPWLIFPGQVLRIPSQKGGAPPPVSPPQPPLPVPTDGSWITERFKVTAYCKVGNMSGGKFVYEGAAAADASLFPLGTRVEVEGAGEFTIEDRFGWDAREYRLDIWKSDCAAARIWGLQFRRLRVLSLGSGAPNTIPGAAAEAEALRFIASRRPDVIAFYRSNGWPVDDTSAMVQNWLGMTHESAVIQAGRNALAIAQSMGMGLDEGLALDYIASRRPDILAFYTRNGWPVNNVRAIIVDWLAMTNEPMMQLVGRRATAVALTLGWGGR
ncbi:MAG: LysM peptidoglycan-binding domain-containing protein [Chloroflexi bacterium]|nr:LysM peptidoglycan-binding domain-containing protein [Chloroflexota bacterium]